MEDAPVIPGITVASAIASALARFRVPSTLTVRAGRGLRPNPLDEGRMFSMRAASGDG
jgi:hypothetical protein